VPVKNLQVLVDERGDLVDQAHRPQVIHRCGGQQLDQPGRRVRVVDGPEVVDSARLGLVPDGRQTEGRRHCTEGAIGSQECVPISCLYSFSWRLVTQKLAFLSQAENNPPSCPITKVSKTMRHILCLQTIGG
jgi:hypothetical protein